MRLVEFVPPVPHPLWKLCLQMGITEVIVKVNPDLTGLADPWRYETLSSIVSRLKSAGLRVVGLEGDPFDMSPIKEYGAGDDSLAAKNAKDAKREESLAHYRELLESMGRLGIKLLCYNFIVGTGWSRTGVREGRGGAKATYFALTEAAGKSEEAVARPGGAVAPQLPRDESGRAVAPRPPRTAREAFPAGGTEGLAAASELKISHAQVWANYDYFIKAVLPTAERCGIRMGLHPDDPCLPSLGGYARIFGSVEAYDRAYALYPSPSNAITFCQANFKLMLTCDTCVAPGESSPRQSNNQTLEAIVRHFGSRIAFIHVRDVEGTREDFTELFHDQGDIDQFALMRTYREIGLDVPVRGDHVPEMEGDRLLTPEGTPGYFTLGRLFANGYLKALLRGTGNG